MASISLSVKYRPVKIGFLVRDGSIEDLVKSAGINTLLWGGIYNPIIPVSKDIKFAEQLINLFSVDVLFPVSHTNEIDELMKKYPLLRDPGHYAQNIFYEDYYTKKNILGYLSSLNTIRYYWEREFKHKPEKHKSNCVLVKWKDEDDLKNLFSILFGFFPQEYNLKDDFESAFLKGLHAQEVKINPNNTIKENLASVVTPIRLTGLELQGYGGTWRGDGIYIGDHNNFKDLLYFWNIRASGLFVEFLPKNKMARFKNFISKVVEILEKSSDKKSAIGDDFINVYYRCSDNEVKDIIKKFKTKKRFVYYKCDEISWNGLNIKPADFYFGWEHILGSVEKSYNRYVVSVSLPEKKFIVKKSRDTDHEHLAISIDPFGEFGYPERTLKPPFIKELNEFYSREIAVDPFALRVEKNGIAEIIRASDNSLFLYPLSHQSIIQKIFELADIQSEISQAGLITKRIIEKLGGVDRGRVFKIEGVRKLLQNLKSDAFVAKGEATKIIWNEGEFRKYEKLYIEAREKSKLTPPDVFNFLLKKDFLRAGLELICNHCKLSNWFSLREIDDIWTCNYCGDENKTSLQLNNRGDWKFRKSGLFAKDNNQEGAIPVILTLLVFLRILDPSAFIYSPSLKLRIKNKKECEVDFVVLQYERGNEIQLAIGECKSEGGAINKEDIENLKMVREMVNKIGVNCYLVFSKTAKEFTNEEIKLFKQLQKEKIPVILLTNRELEPYHPYWELEEKDDLPEKYALDMRGMVRNSSYLYLKD